MAWLILTHRWAGIVLCLMMTVWCLSGAVLMYFGLPHLNAGERLARLPSLDASSIRVAPADAAAKAGGGAFRIRLSMLGDRPVYRVNTGNVFGRWTLVYADNGEVFSGFTPDEAVRWLESYVPEARGHTELLATLHGPDLYTHNPGLQTHMPLYRIATHDAAGTEYYVSQHSGEPVMKTDRVGRFLGFVGYDLHTWFFFRQKSWWSLLLQSLAWTGLGVAILGVILGITRVSLRPRYGKGTSLSHTPYKGIMKWHHVAGLFFGVLGVTWLFSGVVSLDVMPGFRETLYTPRQVEAGARSVQGQGPRLPLTDISAEQVREAAAAAIAAFPVKELELISAIGEPWWLAYRTPTNDEVRNWKSRSAFDFIAPTLNHEHRLISARHPERGAINALPADQMLTATQMAMPDAHVIAADWLDRYDNYYYERHTSFDLGLPQPVKTLPVLRVKFDDPKHTWLYVAPSNGQILKFEGIERANRWGYYALHSFDYGFLFRHRPIWDIAVLILLSGVAVLAGSSLLPAWRRLRRTFRRAT
jgi:hypothetical protein